MPLSAGEKLGVYEILSPLGAGGMGEVYRARDTKLGREVAIKVLPEEFTQHPQKLARFEREARLLAALNHPKIATLYGVEDGSPQPERSAERSGVAEREAVGVGPRGPDKRQPFLIMELVEGQTLADRISQGPIPVGEALELSLQIAEALEAAHEKGVIHRDLKPANIKVDPEGQVKVLDFGLAKAFADEVPESELSQSPTLSRDATRAGVILGTAAYMSPEQAKGKTVDKRTDIFSFGIVLYEMLTGKKAFGGEDVSDVLAAIIRSEPDWDRLPPQSRQLVKRCLEKDRRRRYRDIGDVRFDLESIPTSHATEAKLPGPTSRWTVVFTALLALGVGYALSLLQLGAPTSPGGIVRSQLLPPNGELFDGTSLALSPSGDQLAFAVVGPAELRRLWIRRLDDFEARSIPGTEGADFPFWSPDGSFIGFFADDALKVVSASSGVPRTVTAAPNGRGGTWSADDVILFGSDPGGILYRVDPSGGDAVPVTTRDQGDAHRHPEFLPDGRHFFFYTMGNPITVSFGDLETGETREFIRDAYDAKFVPPHWMVYIIPGTGGAMFAQRLDMDELVPVDDPVSIVDSMRTGGPSGASFTVSRQDVIVYQPVAEGVTLLWLDRSGRSLDREALDPALGWTYRISPSGRRAAFGGSAGISVLELGRDVFQRLPTQPTGSVAQLFPAWSRDETRIAYSLEFREIRIAAVDGSDDQTLVAEGSDLSEITSFEWFPDGEALLVAAKDASQEDNVQLWSIDTGDGSMEIWLSGDADFTEPRFSPDGNWVAYRSNETGVSEVYVRPFPGPGSPVRVSTSGGGVPEWRSDGKELFYLTLDGDLATVDVGYGETLSLSPPKTLIADLGSDPDGTGTRYHVTPDGQRFLVRKVERAPLNFVQGWTQLLTR